MTCRRPHTDEEIDAYVARCVDLNKEPKAFRCDACLWAAVTRPDE